MQKDLADKAFGVGKWWAPKTESVEQGVAEGSDYSKEPNLSKMSVNELKNHIEELTNAATEMFGMERAYIRMDIDKAKAMLRRKLKQGVAEGLSFKDYVNLEEAKKGLE
jgi:vacuolar-type H+-ATPase subunit C/Vma6